MANYSRDRLRRGRGGGDRQAGRSSGRRRGSIWGRTQFHEQVWIPITDADWVTLHGEDPNYGRRLGDIAR